MLNGEPPSPSIVLSPKISSSLLFPLGLDFNRVSWYYPHSSRAQGQSNQIYEVSGFLCVCLEVLVNSIWKFRALGGSDGKASAYNVGDPGSTPGLGRFSGEGNGNPVLPGKSHGRREHGRLQYMGRKELDMTERLHFHFNSFVEQFLIQYR